MELRDFNKFNARHPLLLLFPLSSSVTPPPTAMNRILENGDYRITEDTKKRITE